MFLLKPSEIIGETIELSDIFLNFQGNKLQSALILMPQFYSDQFRKAKQMNSVIDNLLRLILGTKKKSKVAAIAIHLPVRKMRIMDLSVVSKPFGEAIIGIL